MLESWLQQLIDDDKYGLLKIKTPVRPLSEEERAVEKLEEINNFIDKNGRMPSDDSDDILERSLASRIKGFNDPVNMGMAKKLKSIDRHNLLSVTETQPTEISLDDIIKNDPYGMFTSDSDDSIFNIKHGKPANRSVGTFDHVAKQKKCKDFDKFEPLFKQCHEDLKNKKRSLVKFTKEETIVHGNFFVLRGMLLYVDSVGNFEYRNHRQQARTRCIYENGTESDILRNSLAKTMYSEGQMVTKNVDDVLDDMKDVTDEDKSAGYIYVLKSLSKDPQIKGIQDLYKIGWSSTSVKDRIKNAANEPTYLMAKVKIVATYQTFNVNTQKFEDLLHRFFKPAQVKIDVFDSNGTRCSPQEWFQVPFGIIQQAIALLNSGEITKYKYDRETQTIVEI